MATSTLEVLITGDANGLKVALSQGSQAARGFQSSMGGVATGAKAALGKAVPLGAAAAGAAVALFAKQSLEAAVAFDQQFTRIAAITNVPAEAIAGLKTQVLDISRTTGIASDELAKDLFFLESSGLSSAQAMEALHADAMAAAVGLGDVADLGKITAQALNVYSKSGLTAAQVTDTLVATVKETTIVPEELAGSLGRVLPIAAKAGIGFDQVAASIGTMANAGLDAQEGATALRGILQSLAAATPQTTKALETMGLTVDDVVNSLQERGLVGTLRLLDQRAKSVTSTTGEYNQLMRNVIPNVRALTGVFNLTGQEADKVDGIFKSVTNSTGALAKAWDETQKSAAFRFNRALNDIKTSGQEVASVTLPLLASALDTLAAPARNAAEAIGGLNELVQRLDASANQQAGGGVFGGFVQGSKDVVGALGSLFTLDPQGATDKLTSAWGRFTDAIHGNAQALTEDGKTAEQVLADVRNRLALTGLTATEQSQAMADALNSVGGTLTASNFDVFQQNLQDNVAGLQAQAAATDQATQAAVDNARHVQDVTEKNKAWQRQMEALTGKLDSLSNIGFDVNGFLADFKTKLQAADDPQAVFAEGLQTITDAAAAWRQQTADSITGVGDVLGELAQKSHLTAGDVSRAFTKAADAAKSFTHDLVTIADSGGKSAKDLASALLQMGPSAAGLASVVAGAGEDMRKQLIGQFGAILGAGQNGASKLQHALVPVLDDIKGILTAIAKAWGIDVTDNAPAAKEHVDHLHDSLTDVTRETWYTKVNVATNTAPLTALQTQLNNIPKFTDIIVRVHTEPRSPWPDEALRQHLTDPLTAMGAKKVNGQWTVPLTIGVHTDTGGGTKALGNVREALQQALLVTSDTELKAARKQVGGERLHGILDRIRREAFRTGHLNLTKLTAVLRSTDMTSKEIAAWHRDAMRAFRTGLQAPKGSELSPWYQYAMSHVPRLPEGHTRINPHPPGKRDRRLTVRLDRRHFDEQLAYDSDYRGW